MALSPQSNWSLYPVTFTEHRRSDTGGRGFAAQLYWARGYDIWESGLSNPVRQAHLHSNPGGRRHTVPLFADICESLPAAAVGW